MEEIRGKSNGQSVSLRSERNYASHHKCRPDIDSRAYPIHETGNRGIDGMRP